MPSTNKTTNYNLSQFVDTDVPSWLGDYNGDMLKIDGALKQIADNVNDINVSAIILACHPVGSYYWSSNNTDPTDLFGGTWEQIKDKFVLAVGDNYGVPNLEGGESSVTLSVNEIPAHNHRYEQHRNETNRLSGNEVTPFGYISDGSFASYNTTNTGGGNPHNNMPPYITAYCWRRIA